MGEPEYSVTSTEPLKLDQPYKRLRQAKRTVILIFLAIVVCSVVSAVVTTVLEDRSRAIKRAQMAKQQAQTAAEIEQLREFLCDLSSTAPQDPTIITWRTKHCTTAVVSPQNGDHDA